MSKTTVVPRRAVTRDTSQEEDTDQEGKPGAIAGRALECGENRTDIRARKSEDSTREPGDLHSPGAQ